MKKRGNSPTTVKPGNDSLVTSKSKEGSDQIPSEIPNYDDSLEAFASEPNLNYYYSFAHQIGNTPDYPVSFGVNFTFEPDGVTSYRLPNGRIAQAKVYRIRSIRGYYLTAYPTYLDRNEYDLYFIPRLTWEEELQQFLLININGTFRLFLPHIRNHILFLSSRNYIVHNRFKNKK